MSPQAGISIFNSSAYGTAVTDELKSYPAERASLHHFNEQRREPFIGSWSDAFRCVVALLTRNGAPWLASRAIGWRKLFSCRTSPVGLAALAMLIAMLWGGLHALSPGHGKGGCSRLSGRFAWRCFATRSFLGLTVTITHTAGVIALGLVTLLASEYLARRLMTPAEFDFRTDGRCDRL